MDMRIASESLQRQLLAAAAAGGDEALALAERLIEPLDAAIRLTLLEALAVAAEEITCELAPGSVELRLRGRHPEFVVTPPPVDQAVDEMRRGEDEYATGWPVTRGAPHASVEGDEGAMSRINLRMPNHLKARVENAAGSERLSVNAWLVRAAAAALERADPDRHRQPPVAHGAQHYTGWAR